MNVLHVIERLGRGGAERHVLDVSAGLRARGHGTRVLARAGGLLDEPRTDVELVPEGPRALGWADLVSRAVDRDEVDVVHVHSLMPLPAARRAAGRRRPPVPVVFTVHGWPPASLGWRVNALKACRPVVVFAVSEQLGEQLTGRGVRTHVVTNGVPDRNPNGDVRDRSSGPPVLLSVGRLQHPKNQSALVEALVLLRRSGLEARLVLLGEGPDTGMVRQLVRARGLEDAVSMPGFRDPTPYYRDASVFVSASHSEGLSLAYLEALMWGLPLVVTPTSGSAEVVAGDNGVVVANASPEALAAGVRAVLDGDGRTLGRASRALFERTFTQDVMLDRLLDGYELAMGARV